MGSPGRSNRRPRPRSPDRRRRDGRSRSLSPPPKHRRRSPDRDDDERHRRRRGGRGLETFDPSAISAGPAAAGGGGGQLVPAGASGALSLQSNLALSLVAPTVENEKRRTKANIARESRRVHVSHIPPSVTEEALKDMFVTWCDQLRRKMIEGETDRPLADDAILNIDRINDIHLARSKAVPYAFVELTTDDMASRFIADESSVQFQLPGGGVQKVGCRRPRDFTPMQEVNMRKLVLFGLSNPEDTADGVRQIFAQCGPVDVFEVIPPASPTPPGYYIEFAQDKSAAAAVSSLHGEVIGQHVVVVQYATECIRWTLLNLGVRVTGMMGEEALLSSVDLQKDVMTEALNLQAPLPQVLRTFIDSSEAMRSHWPAINPTRILVLLNMFAPDDELDDAAAEQELREVIEQELERYGRLKRLLITRDPPRVPVPPEPFEPRPRPVPADFLDQAPTAPPDGAAAAPTAPPGGGGGGGGGGVLVDASGLSNPRFVEAVAQWDQERRDGEVRFQLETLDYAKARNDWDIECLHPVHGVRARGRVFAEYETVDEAVEAQRSIVGRMFSGRTVITSFLFEDVLYPEPDADSDDGREGEGAPSRPDAAAAAPEAEAETLAPAPEEAAVEEAGTGDID